MKTLLLVQHCQSQHHVNRQARLWLDAKNGLTEWGRRQAKSLAARLREELNQHPCQIYTSCMQRAVATGEILGHELGMSPQSISGLHEYNGRFAMERSEDGEEWEIDNSNWSLFDWRPFPEAETWREFHARCAKAMDGLADMHNNDAIAVLVVHGGTLSNIVLWWLGIPLDSLPERDCFSSSPGSLTVLQKNQYGNRVLERLNDRAHLVALSATDATPNCGIQQTEVDDA